MPGHHRIVSFGSLLVGSLLVGAATAQNGLNESRGPLSGSPMAVLVEGGVAGGHDGQTRAHRNGFTAAPTVPLPPGGKDLAAILNLAVALPGLRIDDISTGRDEVLVAGDGFLTLPPSSWGVLSFSLRHAATGGAAGSRIAQEAALGSLGSAVFSWVLAGSNLPSQVVARTERSHSRSDLGLPAGSEVDGLDLPLVLGLAQPAFGAVEPNFAPLLTPDDRIFFTVSHATRFLAPATWWGPVAAVQNVNRSGATVLVVTRQSPTAPWSAPAVYCNWQELGLLQDEDIDGLAVDHVDQKVMFSLVGTTRDQFLYSDIGTDGGMAGHSVVKTPQGTPISSPTQIGTIQNDDVDAICTLDPIILSSGLTPGGDDFGSSCGSPRQGVLGVPSVHAAAFRRFDGGVTRFDSWMVGWPPATGITAGLAIPFLTLGDDLTLLQLGPIQLRTTTSSTPGNPLYQDLVVPPLMRLSNTRVTFRWVAIDANFTEIAEAWPVQVFL